MVEQAEQKTTGLANVLALTVFLEGHFVRAGIEQHGCTVCETAMNMFNKESIEAGLRTTVCKGGPPSVRHRF